MESLSRIMHTLVELATNLANLGLELLQLTSSFSLLIVWVVWWLLAVNWKRMWPVLGRGAWAPLLILGVFSAFVWSRIQPMSCSCGLGNFWWQLGFVGLLMGVALICGWLQGLLGWAPPEVDLNPPTAAHDAHGHHH